MNSRDKRRRAKKKSDSGLHVSPVTYRQKVNREPIHDPNSHPTPAPLWPETSDLTPILHPSAPSDYAPREIRPYAKQEGENY